MSDRTNAYDCFAPLLADFAACGSDDPRRAQLQDELVEAFLPVVRNIARRFARRGEPLEDLEQVASIALLHALERFDPRRGRDFLSYAVPTIMGEVRRHFRDAAWTVRTPRSIKDRYLQVGTGTARLSQRLGRAPTSGELAEHLGMTREEIAEALAAGGSYRPTSLDRTLADADDASLMGLIGVDDPDLDRVESQVQVRELVSALPERERTMLALRFVHEKTQSEIAAALSISQMHVSRLLARTLRLLRERIEAQQVTDTVDEPVASVA